MDWTIKPIVKMLSLSHIEIYNVFALIILNHSVKNQENSTSFDSEYSFYIPNTSKLSSLGPFKYDITRFLRQVSTFCRTTSQIYCEPLNNLHTSPGNGWYIEQRVGNLPQTLSQDDVVMRVNGFWGRVLWENSGRHLGQLNPQLLWFIGA